MAAGDPVLFSLDPETIAPKGWKWNGDFEWISTDQIALFYTKAHQTSVWHVTLGSGEKKAIGSLAMPFAENIQYRDGKVYYIWRPFESPQKRFLYSQKM